MGCIALYIAHGVRSEKYNVQDFVTVVGYLCLMTTELF